MDMYGVEEFPFETELHALFLKSITFFKSIQILGQVELSKIVFLSKEINSLILNPNI